MTQTFEHADVMRLAPAEFGPDLVVYYVMTDSGEAPIGDEPQHVGFNKMFVNPLLHNMYITAPLTYQSMVQIQDAATRYGDYVDELQAHGKVDDEVASVLKTTFDQIERIATHATATALEGVGPMIERWKRENKTK